MRREQVTSWGRALPSDEITRTFARCLVEARQRAGMSQRDLAAATGMAQGTVANMELARHAPSLPALAQLGEVLQVPLAVLLGEASLPRPSDRQPG